MCNIRWPYIHHVPTYFAWCIFLKSMFPHVDCMPDNLSQENMLKKNSSHNSGITSIIGKSSRVVNLN